MSLLLLFRPRAGTPGERIDHSGPERKPRPELRMKRPVYLGNVMRGGRKYVIRDSP